MTTKLLLYIETDGETLTLNSVEGYPIPREYLYKLNTLEPGDTAILNGMVEIKLASHEILGKITDACFKNKSRGLSVSVGDETESYLIEAYPVAKHP